MFRNLTLILSLIGLLLSRSTYAAEPVQLPEIKTGTFHEYSDKTVTVKCKKWEVVETDSNGFVVCKCDNYLMFRNKDDLNISKITDGKGKELVKYEPEYQGLSFPIEVGKQWESNYKGYTADNNANWNGQLKCEVKALEKVTVPAGSFDAYRIDCEENWTAGSYKGIAHTSRWYAPQANEIVKVTNKEDSRWNQELKSFELK